MVLARRMVPGAPWYRQFWPWFLLAVPGVAVVGGVATLVVAIRHADSVVRDDWYTSGLGINIDLARDRAAADLGLVAQVRLDAGGQEIQVRFAAGGDVPDRTLHLELHHPTQASRDRLLELVRDGTGAFRAAARGDLAGRWHATLAPRAGAWRLAGPITLRPGETVALAPRP